MIYKLKEINRSMGLKEYLMYQEIPYEENGALNDVRGMTYHNYKTFLRDNIKGKKVKLTDKDTPKISYIFYVNNLPVGEICIRPVLNDYWKIHSGNIGYKIRPSQRNKGYGTRMLKYAIKRCKRLKMKEVILETTETNVYSRKVIESNNGKLYKKEENICFYIIKI